MSRPHARARIGQRRRLDQHELRRPLHRQRAKRHSVDQREDRGVDAHSQAERDDDEQGERRRPREAANGHAQVATRRVHRRQTPLVAIALLRLFHAAEGEQRLPPGRVRSDAPRNQIVGHQLDVRVQFPGQNTND